MGKNSQENAKGRARQYLTRAQSDGKLTRKEISKAQDKGLSMDRILYGAADSGTRIGHGAQEQYGIQQGKNTSRIDYTPSSAAAAKNAAASFRYPTKGQYPASESTSPLPAAMKHGLYAGVDKKGQHVYRYGTGQPRATSQPTQTATPSPQETAPQQNTGSTPVAQDPQGGKSWNDFIAGNSESGGQSNPSSAGASSYGGGGAGASDPNNPNLYSDISNEGVGYQKRFGRFIDYANQNAMSQAQEIGNAGRSALARLQAIPPKIQDPLSKETAKSINRFSRRLDFG